MRFQDYLKYKYSYNFLVKERASRVVILDFKHLIRVMLNSNKLFLIETTRAKNVNETFFGNRKTISITPTCRLFPN